MCACSIFCREGGGVILVSCQDLVTHQTAVNFVGQVKVIHTFKGNREQSVAMPVALQSFELVLTG